MWEERGCRTAHRVKFGFLGGQKRAGKSLLAEVELRKQQTYSLTQLYSIVMKILQSRHQIFLPVLNVGDNGKNLDMLVQQHHTHSL